MDDTEKPWRPPVGVALGRGLRKRCPHCGRGPLYRGWADTLDACPECGLVYERNPGDTWFYTIVGDRLPVAAAIVVVYFGVMRWNVMLGSVLLAVLAVSLLATAPNRWGAGIALHYLSRAYFPDPADPVPPPVAADTDGISSRSRPGGS